MTLPATGQSTKASSALAELARRKEKTWAAAWAAMCKWIDAPPERRKGKLQREVDAACEASIGAAAAWRDARAKSP